MLVGHVDHIKSGPGALYHLDRVESGDRIDVTVATGQSSSYHVAALHIVDKRHGLPASLFSATGRPELIVVTCGGPYDNTTHSYADNIIASAEPTKE